MWATMGGCTPLAWGLLAAGFGVGAGGTAQNGYNQHQSNQQANPGYAAGARIANLALNSPTGYGCGAYGFC